MAINYAGVFCVFNFVYRFAVAITPVTHHRFQQLNSPLDYSINGPHTALSEDALQQTHCDKYPIFRRIFLQVGGAKLDI